MSEITLDKATVEQLEAEIATRRAAEVEEATAVEKAATELHVTENCPKVAAAGLKVGVERTDEQYVTIDLPDPLPANWALIRKAMGADLALTAIDGDGCMRVRKDRAVAVLDFIETHLPK